MFRNHNPVNELDLVLIGHDVENLVETRNQIDDGHAVRIRVTEQCCGENTVAAADLHRARVHHQNTSNVREAGDPESALA